MSRLIELQHHRSSPVSDLDGGGQVEPFTRGQWVKTGLLLILWAIPLTWAIVTRWDRATLQQRQALEADEKAMREAMAAHRKLQIEVAEHRRRLAAMQAQAR